MSFCYLNGEFLPREQACISPMDRGFLFGDGAYEVIPVYARQPFRLEAHLRRLENTLAGLGIPQPHARAEWAAYIEALVAHNAGDDQAVYVQVTRGVDERRNHAFPERASPTVFMMSDPLAPVPEVQLAEGVGMISLEDNRWLRCDLKTTALLANCLLRQQAVAAGCAEALLLRDGFLTEGSASNIFVVCEGVLVAPPKSHLILPGITYDVVLELAAEYGLPYETRAIAESEVRSADEIWMTSSTKEVLPVTRLDGRPVGSGRPGAVWQQMHAWFVACRNGEKRHGRSAT